MASFIVEHGGGALVEKTPFDRRVVGSNPSLAPCRDLEQIIYLQLLVALRRVNSDTVSIAESGALPKGSCCGKRYRNGQVQFILLSISLLQRIQRSTLIIFLLSPVTLPLSPSLSRPLFIQQSGHCKRADINQTERTI